MYRVEKHYTFEAMHKLPQAVGRESRPHGHSWSLWIVVDLQAEQAERFGAGIIEGIAGGVIASRLEHQNLNCSTSLENPTPVTLSRWLYHLLLPRFEREGIKLAAVAIQETPDARCQYEPGIPVEPGRTTAKGGRPRLMTRRAGSGAFQGRNGFVRKARL